MTTKAPFVVFVASAALGCRQGAPPALTFSVTNATVEVPAEVAPGKSVSIKGSFQVVSSVKELRVPVLVKIVQPAPGGSGVTVASQNVKTVARDGSVNKFETAIQAPRQPGTYGVQVFAASEPAGQGAFVVK